MILLISSDNQIADMLAQTLSDSAPVRCFESLAQLKVSCDSDADWADISLIILDAQHNLSLISSCQEWCKQRFVANIPLIAIIANTPDRAAALEAGADDYLLTPLIPAELQARLINQVRTVPNSFNIWLDAFRRVNNGIPPKEVLDETVRHMAQLFHATAGWLSLFDAAGAVDLLITHNVPRENVNLEAEAQFFRRLHRAGEVSSVQINPVWQETRGEEKNGNFSVYHLTIPLTSNKNPIGLLTLIYPERPNVSETEKHTLQALGQDIGALLAIFHLQNETQIHATQNAFMILIARTLSERLDLESILALSLEQAVPLVNATGGDIWLLSGDGEWLELAASLSVGACISSVTRRGRGQGLLGWVIDQGRSVNIGYMPAAHPRFDPRVDRLKNMENYALLIVPVRHRDEVIGVMSLYNKNGTPFSNADAILLESIANLMSSAIANARLMQELRDYADQQRALYEMSHQIAAGLDLKATLQRVLVWIGRLLEVSFGLLWLVEEFQEANQEAIPALCLNAALGKMLSDDDKHIFTIEQGLVGWVVRTGKAVVVNTPAQDDRFNPAEVESLGITARNILAVPMVYRGQIIGAISLYNKIDGLFTDDDLALLQTATEMAAVTVGNARLHEQTVKLLKDRERLYKQIIQSERFITVGRLTASISHEINNPMQTIRSALALALEDSSNHQKLKQYLQISMEESERIVQLVGRMRQIYRPHGDTPEALDINELLKEASAIARKELRRKRVLINIQLGANLPAITAIADQLHLVFLSLMLNLGDAITDLSRDQELQVRSDVGQRGIKIELIAFTRSTSIANWNYIFSGSSAEIRPDEDEASFGLSFCYEIIVAHGGAICIEQDDQQTICRIELPLSTPETIDLEQVNQLPLLNPVD